jgi:hypothetical protein
MTVDSSHRLNQHRSFGAILFLLILWVFTTPVTAWGQLAKPLEPKTSHQDTYAESITAVADFSDGTYLLVQYFVTNVGMGSEKGACKVIVLKKGQEAYSEGEQVKKSKWGYQPDSQMLEMAGCTIQNQKDGVTMAGTVGDFSFDLKYQQRARHIPVPDSFLSNGKDFYEYEIYVPWSRVSGYLTKEGDPPMQLSGFGAIDHSRSTTMPRDIASRWIHFLGLHQGKRCIVRMRFPNEDTPPSVWVWREGDSKPVLIGSMRVTPMDKVPEGDSFKIEAKLNDDHFIFSVQTFLYRYAPLEEYGLLGAMLQPWVGRPETRTYRATLKDAKSGVESPGILSISSNYK